MQDFDYYREKLTGLSPATISILTDLEIEQKKDIAASILQYENLGLIVKEADNSYHVTEKYHSYNDMVTKYNTAIQVFPKSMVAGIFGFKKRDLLEAGKEERESIKITSDTF